MRAEFSLGAQDAATILGVSIRRVLQLATRERRIRYRTVNARRKLYHVADVLAVLHDRTSPSVEAPESHAQSRPSSHGSSVAASADFSQNGVNA
jgi:hypothetical protein